MYGANYVEPQHCTAFRWTRHKELLEFQSSSTLGGAKQHPVVEILSDSNGKKLRRISKV